MKSILLINGNDPKSLLNSTLYGATALAYDLHDAVDAANKDAARLLVQEALFFFDYAGTPVFVRVNPMQDCGAEDMGVVGQSRPQAFILPQADPQSLPKAHAALSEVEKQHGLAAGSIGLIPTVETVLSVERVHDVLAASTRIQAVLFEAKNFLQDLGVQDSDEAEQLLYARSRVALACRMAGVAAIDRPYYNAKDRAGFESDARRGRSLGFCGKLAVSGSQVPLLNEIFA